MNERKHPIRVRAWQNGGRMEGEFNFVRDAAKGLGYFASRSYKNKERVAHRFALSFAYFLTKKK